MQSTRTTRDVHIEALSRFKWVFYFVALLMVVPPVVDFGLNVLPWRPGQIQWRYGAVGLVSGFLMTTVLGAAMVAGLAAWFGHRWIQRITGILWLISGGLLVLACAGFMLDMLQLRAEVPVEQRWTFDVAGIKAALKNLAGAAALLWLGIVAVRSTRPRRVRSEEPRVFTFPAGHE